MNHVVRDDTRVRVMILVMMTTRVTIDVLLAVKDITKIRLDRLSVLSAPQAATVRTLTMLNVRCVPREDLSVESRRLSVIRVPREIM